MREWLAAAIADPYCYWAALKRWLFGRSLVSSVELGRGLTDVERLRNISRSLFGDDRLLR